MPGVVSIPHGWGHGRKGVKKKIAQAHAGVSVNDLTDDTLIDPLSGNAAVNGVPVQLEAITPEKASLDSSNLDTTDVESSDLKSNDAEANHAA